MRSYRTRAGGARVGRRGVWGGSHALGESRGVVGRRPRRRGGRGRWSCKLAYFHCQLLYYGIVVVQFVLQYCMGHVWGIPFSYTYTISIQLY